MTWREGVHVSGTGLWCDARRVRDVCFVSRAEAIRSPRHGQLISSMATLTLLSRRDKSQQPTTALPVPHGRPFTLGTLRLELLRSGVSIGSSSLAIDLEGGRIVYAGAVNPVPSALGGELDLRTCATLILDAEYGHPRYRFPAIDEVIPSVVGFCHRAVKAGGTAVLLVQTPSKGLEVAKQLTDSGLSLAAHRAIHHAGRRIQAEQLADLPPIRRAGKSPRGGEVLLWLARARSSLPTSSLPKKSRVALLSGRAIDAEAIAALGADHGFVWSDQGDHEALLNYVRACRAEQVFLTGRGAEPLSRVLAADHVVRTLGPPHQMNLF